MSFLVYCLALMLLIHSPTVSCYLPYPSQTHLLSRLYHLVQDYLHYLQIPHIVGAGELTPLAAAMIAGGLGFLWFNTYPAQVFMGDVGSLSLVVF